MKKITIIIPCYNEEKGIAKVIADIPVRKLAHLGYKTEIIVVDNNSNDRTSRFAGKKGAKIVLEKKQGKGAAVALVHPQTLSLQLTHFAPWPREDTFGEISFVVSFLAFFIWNLVKDNK